MPGLDPGIHRASSFKTYRSAESGGNASWIAGVKPGNDV
jgi:hypothetical protein